MNFTSPEALSAHLASTINDSSLIAEYVAGLTLKQLGARHGINPRVMWDWVNSNSRGHDLAKISRESRERLAQQEIHSIGVAAGQAFGLKPGMIWSARRTNNLVFARFAAFFVANEDYGHKTTVIGRTFGLDHSTIVHGRDRARDLDARNYLGFADNLTKLRRCLEVQA